MNYWKKTLAGTTEVIQILMILSCRSQEAENIQQESIVNPFSVLTLCPRHPIGPLSETYWRMWRIWVISLNKSTKLLGYSWQADTWADVLTGKSWWKAMLSCSWQVTEVRLEGLQCLKLRCLVLQWLGTCSVSCLISSLKPCSWIEHPGMLTRLTKKSIYSKQLGTICLLPKK